jgi:hypothetical protein
MPASMPEVPLALKQSDRPSGRCQSAFIPSTRTRRRSQKSGSRWPFIGRDIASRTLGFTFDGPGPHNKRSPGSSAGIVSTSAVMFSPPVPKERPFERPFNVEVAG